MTYLVLARKWRPTTFEEVVGQAHVTRTLASAIESERVGHAYLFSGPRGVGKTTTARLLAKSLNCPNAKGAVPCNDCDVCREITSGVSLDVIEIDAASNRGIDEIRNLRENVKYAPAGGKFKVYVVDEVHMLTEAAFNALLKTLEEPPSHAKFILATTAPLKVPETILSRCQRFEFVRIPVKEIFTRLKHICSEEKFNVDDAVLMLLSRKANGSLRDAESMMDQLVSAGLEGASESEIAQLLGMSGAEVFFSLIDAVKSRDVKRAIEVLGSLFDSGANLDEFTEGLMEHLRNLLLIKIHPDLSSLVEASKGHVKLYEEQAKHFSEGDILRLINIVSRASASVPKSVLPRLHLEMAVVEMSYLDSTAQLSELIRKLDVIEASLADFPQQAGQIGGASVAPESRTSVPEEERPAVAGADKLKVEEKPAVAGGPESLEREPETEVQEPRVEAPEPEITADSLKKWNQVVSRLAARKKSLAVCLSPGSFRGISQGKVIIGFGENKSFERSIVESKTNKKIIQEELSAIFKTTLGVSCVKIESKPEERAIEAPANPAGQNEAALDENDSLKEILETFDGEIIED